jgi:hypothetical protein
MTDVQIALIGIVLILAFSSYFLLVDRIRR